MESREPGEVYWRAVETIWKKVNIYESPEVFLTGFQRVPRSIGHLYAVHWCQSEVRNGGFHQFFYNPTGVLAPEAALGFDEIGLKDCGELLRGAMKFFGSNYPRDRDARMDFLEEHDGKTKEAFRDLETRFYSALRGTNHRFERKADAFALEMVV